MAKTRRRHGRGFRLRKPHSDFDTPLRAEFQGLAEIRKKTLLRAIFVFGVRLMRAKKKKRKKTRISMKVRSLTSVRREDSVLPPGLLPLVPSKAWQIRLTKFACLYASPTSRVRSASCIETG